MQKDESPHPLDTLLGLIPTPVAHELRRFTLPPIQEFKLVHDNTGVAEFWVCQEGQSPSAVVQDGPLIRSAGTCYVMQAEQKALDDYDLQPQHLDFLTRNAKRRAHFRIVWDDRHLDFAYTTREKMLYDLAQTHASYGERSYLLLLPGPDEVGRDGPEVVLIRIVDADRLKGCTGPTGPTGAGPTAPMGVPGPGYAPPPPGAPIVGMTGAVGPAPPSLTVLAGPASTKRKPPRHPDLPRDDDEWWQRITELLSTAPNDLCRMQLTMLLRFRNMTNSE